MKNNESYSVGYEEHVLKLFSKRSAFIEAKFILPYIKPDSNILDCGCGIGSITLDFAKLAYNGQVTGIDLNIEQTVASQEYSKYVSMSNISFKAGSVYELPFSDNQFDIVYSNAVLCQLADPLAAIKEMIRVTKPGGYITARDMDWGGTIYYPESEILNEAIMVREKAISALGANYRIGRTLRDLFNQSGMNEIIGSADAEYVGNSHSLNNIMSYISSQWEVAPFAAKAKEMGLTNDEKIKDYQQELLKFAENPSAFQAWIWCHAIGRKVE